MSRSHRAALTPHETDLLKLKNAFWHFGKPGVQKYIVPKSQAPRYIVELPHQRPIVCCSIEEAVYQFTQHVKVWLKIINGVQITFHEYRFSSGTEITACWLMGTRRHNIGARITDNRWATSGAGKQIKKLNLVVEHIINYHGSKVA